MNVLILGVNGFIGHHLTQLILETKPWHVYGMDMRSDRVEPWLEHPRFHFFEGDITINREWVEYHIKKCDVVMPLVAIATPGTYVTHPLSVFELDFEANLPIVRACVRYKKRLIFPSTSEVYGMSTDTPFHPATSRMVYGPIEKQRWIYSCCKQLLDRVIWAYGQRDGLDFTLFRPFNWLGPGLDSLHTAKEGSSRVVTQFLGHIARGEPISLVDGGAQRRCFTDVRDGVEALVRMIENPNGAATGKIYNLGHPDNDLSIRELAERMLAIARHFPEYASGLAKVKLLTVDADQYYGRGYQDIANRVPWIDNVKEDLGWEPKVGTDDALTNVFEAYRHEVAAARALLDDEPDAGADRPQG